MEPRLDSNSLKALTWSYIAEGFYRHVLVLAALIGGFTAFPNAKLFVGGLVFLVANGIITVLLGQELVEQRMRRFSWAEELTVRIALIELHNASLDGQRMEIEWDGSTTSGLARVRPRWRTFRNTTPMRPASTAKAQELGAGIVQFGLHLLVDLIFVGIASFVSGA